MNKDNHSLFENDKSFRDKYPVLAGTDEAGRGPLAGPVVCASVILPADFYHELLDDSKKLTDKKRDILFDIIKENAVAYHISIIDEKQIDSLNILQATLLGMKNSLENLSVKPDLALIDGNKLPKTDEINCFAVVGGDRKHACISAASILAKVSRDRIMDEFDIIYPHYGFKKHKGYPTADHLKAIRSHGICEIHRRSYKPVMQLTLEDMFLE